MPRMARVKSQNSIYHIMVRSISEVDLFRQDEDKCKYFHLIKKYQQKYKFKVYAYCLMTNHGHLMIDCNGADISRVMHSINFCYAQYYNRKYERHGHLFQDRFKSKIVKDEKYLITLSAYIHNNANDLAMYKDHVEDYPFSSLQVYIKGINRYGILDLDFLKRILYLNNKKNVMNYLKLVKRCEALDMDIDIEFENVKTEYRSERKIIPRDYQPKNIIKQIAEHLEIDKEMVRIKYNRECTQLRAVSCFLMSCYCNISQKDICSILGNISQTRVSQLCNKGMEYAFMDKGVIQEFSIGV